MAEIAVVADDLSGAVEAAAAFLPRTTRINVSLTGQSTPPAESSVVHVVDTDSRHLTATAAAERVATAFLACRDVRTVLKKVDSLLRGNLVGELVAVRELRPNVIVAPALPAAGRTVRDGIVHINGRPTAETDAWRAESKMQHGSVLAALAPLPAVPINLDSIRSERLAGVLVSALQTGKVPVCDALTDGDLDKIVAAATRVDRRVLVGSAGLAAAIARTMDGDDTLAVSRTLRAGTVLVVVGSAASGIPAQLQALEASRPDVVLVHPDALEDEAALSTLMVRAQAATTAVTVVAIDPSAAVDPSQSRNLAQALARVATPAARPAAALLLTGGETARLVLDRLGVQSLQPLFSVHHGAVVSAAPDGQLIATRPGSFGGPKSLLDIVRALQNAHSHLTKEQA